MGTRAREGQIVEAGAEVGAGARREEAEVEGRVGDDVSLGTLGGAGHDLVSQPGGDS